MSKANKPVPGAGHSRRQRVKTLRTHSAHITGPDVNAVGLVNDMLMADQREATRQRNGETLTPGARRLLAKAQREQSKRLIKHNTAAIARGKSGDNGKSSQKVRYRKGVTQPATVEQLQTEAARDPYQHSRALGRHMKSAGLERPSKVHAHHIVARKAGAAERSRTILVNWGIAINDVDNGVFLPAYRNTEVPDLPHATKHAVVHTQIYHLAVFDRLSSVDQTSTQAGRLELRSIKSELLEDTFPYRPEDEA